MVPALLLLAIHYRWVCGTEARFEEGSITLAEKRAAVARRGAARREPRDRVLEAPGPAGPVHPGAKGPSGGCVPVEEPDLHAQLAAQPSRPRAGCHRVGGNVHGAPSLAADGDHRFRRLPEDNRGPLRHVRLLHDPRGAAARPAGPAQRPAERGHPEDLPHGGMEARPRRAPSPHGHPDRGPLVLGPRVRRRRRRWGGRADSPPGSARPSSPASPWRRPWSASSSSSCRTGSWCSCRGGTRPRGPARAA